MRKITSPHHFRWDTRPAPEYYLETEYYHVVRRKSYHMLPLGDANNPNEMLCAGLLVDVSMLTGARYLKRNSPCLTIEYVSSGSLSVRQRDSAWVLEAGEVFLMQPRVEGEFLCDAPECRRYSLMVEGRLLSAWLTESGLGARDVVGGLDRRGMERIFRQFGQLAERSNQDSRDRNAFLTFELLRMLSSPGSGEEPSPALSRLREDIEARPEADWSREEMARRCHCSPTHLTRSFGKHFGVTPHQMVLELRMRRARRLLANGNLSIKQISARVGYGNALNFSTEFRKRFQVSPREYRNQLSHFS